MPACYRWVWEAVTSQQGVRGAAPTAGQGGKPLGQGQRPLHWGRVAKPCRENFPTFP
jgi:hypothetical protein